MYTVAVRTDFIAVHRLEGAPGGEERPHAHHYLMEARFQGSALDRRGYLVDICEVAAALAALAGRYRDQELNRLPEFAGRNPSLENFARILCEQLVARVALGPPAEVSVRLWENERAWAAYRKAL